MVYSSLKAEAPYFNKRVVLHRQPVFPDTRDCSIRKNRSYPTPSLFFVTAKYIQ